MANQTPIKTLSGLKDGGVYGALNLPTANVPVEAKVGASRLANRRTLIVVFENAGMFWGLDSSVTSTTGVPATNGGTITFDIDPESTFQIWLVGSTNNKNAHIVECP